MIFTKQDLKKLKFKFDKWGDAKRVCSLSYRSYWKVHSDDLNPFEINGAYFRLETEVNIKDEYTDDLGNFNMSCEIVGTTIYFSKFNSFEQAETFFNMFDREQKT